jgi:hypothetical protein
MYHEAPGEVPATLAACKSGENISTPVRVGAVGGGAASVDGGGNWGNGTPGGWADHRVKSSGEGSADGRVTSKAGGAELDVGRAEPYLCRAGLRSMRLTTRCTAATSQVDPRAVVAPAA